jgi:hypothetical protein
LSHRRTKVALQHDPLPVHANGARYMTNTGEARPRPALFDAALSTVEVTALRAYVEDVSRWVIGEAVDGQLTDTQCDSLAAELAAILATGLAPALSRDIARNTEKVIADLQDGPVSLDADGQLAVDGFVLPELMRLLDAIGQLIENGVGEPLQLLHESHRRSLLYAHDAWAAKQVRP